MDFGEILKSVEDAVFEVMIWILLLPKTLFRVMIKPKWAMEYVTEEWKKDPEEEERFDEYLSPVLLWLLSAVIPITAAFVFISPDINTAEDFFNALSSRISQVTFYMMVIPFVYIAWMEWLNKEPVKRSTLKISFYRHCYLLAPAQILTFISPVLWMVTPFLIIVTVFIVPAYEAFVFQSELKVGYWRAFFYACVPQIIVVLPLVFLAIGVWADTPS